MHPHSCFNAFPKPYVTIFMAESEYTHEKNVYNIQCYWEGCIHHTVYRQGFIQHSAYLDGAYTQYNLPFPAPLVLFLGKACT